MSTRERDEQDEQERARQEQERQEQERMSRPQGIMTPGADETTTNPVIVNH
jgi:hypothetical protein